MNYIGLSDSVLNQLSSEEINLCIAYIRFVNNKIEEQLKQSGFKEKFAEVIAKGLPYCIDKDFNIKMFTEEEFYKTPAQEGKE